MLPECDICNKSNLILCSQEMPNVEISQGDLYAPLLLLILLSSLLCSLLACSCSRLSSRWWIARWSWLRVLIQQQYDQDDGELKLQPPIDCDPRDLASPEKELEGGQDPEPTEALAR